MTSDDLMSEQVAALTASVRRRLRYLGKLRDRMNANGFPPDDRLYRAAQDAFNAVHALSVAMLACEPGTAGRAKFELRESETPTWIRATEPSTSPSDAIR